MSKKTINEMTKKELHAELKKYTGAKRLSKWQKLRILNIGKRLVEMPSDELKDFKP